jgi:dGTP triphosphohydrolase
MRKNVVLLVGLVAVFGLSTMLAGCSSKPSCKLLYKRYKDCKKMPLTEEAFVSMCDKLKDRAQTKAEIACSAKSDCDDFKKCIKQAEKAGRAERMNKRWKVVMEKAKKGKYSSAMTFCEIWKDELTDEFKSKCKGLPAKAADALMKEHTAKRDAGKVSYKEVKCWDLKRYAKKAGPDKLKKAELLCKEIALARDVNSVKEAVAKNLKKASPYLPYQCSERQLKKYRKLGTPYAKKAVGIIVQECYKKLGVYILQKKLPKQKYTCWVKDVYKGIKKYKITGPKIDELMKKAAEKCEKKK